MWDKRREIRSEQTWEKELERISEHNKGTVDKSSPPTAVTTLTLTAMMQKQSLQPLGLCSWSTLILKDSLFPTPVTPDWGWTLKRKRKVTLSIPPTPIPWRIHSVTRTIPLIFFLLTSPDSLHIFSCLSKEIIEFAYWEIT